MNGKQPSTVQLTVKFLVMQVPRDHLNHVDAASSTASQKIEAKIRQITPDKLPPHLHLIAAADTDLGKEIERAASWAVYRTSTHHEVSAFHLPDFTLKTLQQINLSTADPVREETILIVTSDATAVFASNNQPGRHLEPYKVSELE